MSAKNVAFFCGKHFFWEGGHTQMEPILFLAGDDSLTQIQLIH